MLSSPLSLSLRHTHTHSYFRAVVRFGLQFVHGNQSLKEAALQEAHWRVSVKTGLWIGQDQFEGHSEAGHVHREGTTGTPAGVEAHHLRGITRNTNTMFSVGNNSVVLTFINRTVDMLSNLTDISFKMLRFIFVKI